MQPSHLAVVPNTRNMVVQDEEGFITVTRGLTGRRGRTSTNAQHNYDRSDEDDNNQERRSRRSEEDENDQEKRSREGA